MKDNDSDMVTINVAGDVFLGRRMESVAINSPEKLIGNQIKKLFSDSDLNILNLESPLTDAGKDYQISKTGPNLKASPDAIGVLDLLNTHIVTLANNHIYDYGEKGLLDTLELCTKHNISTVGAGLNKNEASQILLKEVKGIKIGFVNIAENEWSNADEKRGGANPMNIIENTRSIKKARELADIVVLIIHGGHELYYYPSPRMRDQYRFYAEQGASIIVGHHSHCLSGYEVYKDVPVFYGLGNFLFAANTGFEGWHDGILLRICISHNGGIKWTLYPYTQNKSNFRVELMRDSEKAAFEDKIIRINEIIDDPKKLENEFEAFVSTKKKDVLATFSTSNIFNSRYFQSAIRKSGLEPFFLRRKQLKSILNHTRCEAHRDVVFKILSDYINTK